MLFVFLLTILLSILQVSLISIQSIFVHVEIYFFPWLVSKGLMPDRDFFDHHGFLTKFLLNSLAFDHSLLVYKILFYVIQTINLFLIIYILNKILKASKTKVVFLSCVYTIVIYFWAGNTLWFENFITTLFLIVYLLSISKEFNHKASIIGILIALATFIKPTAALILFPFFIVRKEINTIISFTVCWIIVFIFYYFNNSLMQLIRNLFVYNFYLPKNYSPYQLSDHHYLFDGLFITAFAICYIIYRKNFKKVSLSFGIFLISFIFPQGEYGRPHIVPLTTFGIIILAYALKDKFNYYSVTLTVVIIFYTLNIAQQIKHEYVFQYINTTISQKEYWNESVLIANKLKKINPKNEKVYLMSGDLQIYMFINQLPPTYFPNYFKGTEKFFPNYSQKVIQDLKKNKVDFVVSRNPIERDYRVLTPKLTKYILSFYKPCVILQLYTVYCKK